MRRSLGLLFCLVLPVVALAERDIASPSFSAGSGIAMRITNCYETLPPAGFLPLKVEVQNDSDEARKWEFRTSHTLGRGESFRFVTSLPVPAHGKRVFDVLVPLGPQAVSSGRYSNLNIFVSGYAVEDGTTAEHATTGGGGSATAFFGMGEALSVTHWGPLKDHVEKKSSGALDGTPLDPSFLPTDWRALAGFEIIFFTDAEWRVIPVPQQEALRDWIAQGGELVLCHEGETAPVDLPAVGSWGVGRISHWPMGSNFVEQVSAEIVGKKRSVADLTAEEYNRDWELVKAVGFAGAPQTLIILFVVCFGALIGPVNFFVFAPAGNRHRLFWTTPLLSVAATLLIAGLIVGSEGIGGKGQRMEALLSLPSTHKAVLWQEQVSRTGMLSTAAFTPSEEILLFPVSLRRAEWVLQQGRNYQLDGAVWSGDWFRNRTTQAQLLVSAFPTRGRLELVAADGQAPPQVVSTFEQPLKELFYYDESGQEWHAANVAPGRKVSLEPAKPEQYKKWKNKVMKPAEAVINKRFDQFEKQDRKGKFFASTQSVHPVSTITAVKWNSAGAVIFGEVFRP